MNHQDAFACADICGHSQNNRIIPVSPNKGAKAGPLELRGLPTIGQEKEETKRPVSVAENRDLGFRGTRIQSELFRRTVPPISPFLY